MKNSIRIIEPSPEILTIAAEVSSDFYQSVARKIYGKKDIPISRKQKNISRFKAAIVNHSIKNVPTTDRQITRLCVNIERRTSIMS